MAKRRYALPLHKPHLFYQFSPEAFLLTLVHETRFCHKIKKERKGLSGRAAGSMAREVAAIDLT